MATTATPTSVAMNARRAVSGISQGFSHPAMPSKPGLNRRLPNRCRVLADERERVLLEARRHGVVLAGPLTRAALLAVAAAAALVAGWPAALAAPPLLAVAAAISLAAVTRWERTRLVVTTEKVFLVHGVLRRRASAVRLGSLAAVEVDQTLTGRVLGYGTLVLGPLEVTYIARPRWVSGLVTDLGTAKPVGVSLRR